MPDLLRMTASPEYLTGASVFLQPLAQVVEIAHIDQVDVRFYLYSLTSGISVTFELRPRCSRGGSMPQLNPSEIDVFEANA